MYNSLKGFHSLWSFFITLTKASIVPEKWIPSPCVVELHTFSFLLRGHSVDVIGEGGGRGERQSLQHLTATVKLDEGKKILGDQSKCSYMLNGLGEI